ncbi:MAG: GNAT family N-acetyltransferase, partial [Chloroflexales bacterium]|nr:GNAT family N-acetyltransferase [Chloroflexales bacterium]
AWQAALPALFVGVALRPSPALFYGYTAATPPAPADVPGVTFEPIDRTLLARADIAGSAPVRQEIGWMWPSLDLFYMQGLGQAAIADGDVVCFCTSEYVSATLCGIGIATTPAYQRRGIATAATQRFVAEALRRSLTPYWECSGENIASMRTAEKVGFALIERATYWIGSFDSAAPQC